VSTDLISARTLVIADAVGDLGELGKCACSCLARKERCSRSCKSDGEKCNYAGDKLHGGLALNLGKKFGKRKTG
jgi:hypothetical protein